MLNWPIQKTVKELRALLGLTGNYRLFARNYGVRRKPHSNLLPKRFWWDMNATLAFEQLMKAMASAPVLAKLDFTKPFLAGNLCVREGNRCCYDAGSDTYSLPH